jgi:PPOX class probable FMN-dependent enzyme
VTGEHSNPSPHWRSLIERALGEAAGDPAAYHVQVATVTPGGRPANRTVVFRGFIAGTDWLCFVTDVRSQKARHVRNQPWGEVCWYLAASRQQFRLAGELALVTGDETDAALQQARQAAWTALSDRTRRQFFWPEPLLPRARPAAFEVAAPDGAQPPATFCLLVLRPTQVDHLDVGSYPHRRTVYRLQASGQWSQETVNP